MSKLIDDLAELLDESKVQVTFTGWKKELEATEKARDLYRKHAEAMAKELHIAVDQLMGVALCIQEHGQNINVNFFIETYTYASQQRGNALTAYREAVK